MDTIWIGEIEGEALVFDAAIQLPDCPHLFLWSPADCEMGKYIADLTRQRIKPYKNHTDAIVHINSYHNWRNSFGAKWLADERRHYDSKKEIKRTASLILMERHKRKLEMLGKEYLGVRPANRKLSHHRVTRCYNCKKPLDNSIDVECVACSWILCSCGACRCSYKDIYGNMKNSPY